MITLDLIDEQHEALSCLFEEIFRSSVADGHSALPPLLAALSDLLLVHFRDEEHLMAHAAYPELTGHRWQHETLIGELRRIVSNVTTEISLDQLTVLREIIHDHMKESDSLFAHFYQREVVAQSSD